MTLIQFSQVFALLAVQLRHTDVDAATIRAYYKILQDLEPEFVAIAADRFAHGAAIDEHGKAWFPKAPEWRAMVRLIDKERTEAYRALLRKLPTPLCQACEDTGWRPVNTLIGKRFTTCECRELRRLEVLGRRPKPQLPESSGDGELDPRVQTAVAKLAAEKGMP